MMKLGASTIAYHAGSDRCAPNSVTVDPDACRATISEVDIVPALMNTATMDSPIDTSYEIICADDRSAPSSGYVDPDAHPASTTPYTPIDEQASTSNTATGMSVSCSGDSVPKIRTDGPNGITENAVNAHTAEMIGAKKYTTLSAARGMMSSLKASFSPSASDCSSPNGPTRFGPGRTCIRATTRPPYQIANRAITTRNANTATTLMSTSHHGSCPNWSSGPSARFMRHLPR